MQHFCGMHQTSLSTTRRIIHRINHMRAIYRMLICLFLAAVVTLAFLPVRMEWLTRIMVSWDCYCLSFLCLSAMSFLTMKAEQIRLHAKTQDASRSLVSIIVIVSCVTSIVAVLDLLSNRRGWSLPKGAETSIYLFGVFASWLLLHTVFTYRYAHYYYGDHPNDPNQEAGGLEIPGHWPPTYLDFAYFSFVIGMTFQVSDIAITSPRLRKMALGHALLSFIFNTVIVALTINEVVNLQS
jgi:uncharacterized membrane protein